MNERRENCSYLKEHPIEEWTMTSSWIDNVLSLSGLPLSAEADRSRMFFCEQYMQDHFLEPTHRLHDQELIERLKQRETTVKRLDNKQRREQEVINVKQSDISTSTNDDDPIDDTTGIVQTGPRQFEIYIETRRDFDEYTRREMEEQDD